MTRDAHLAVDDDALARHTSLVVTSRSLRARRARVLLSVSLALAALLGACAPALPQPSADDARAATARYHDVTLAELEAGRSAYVSRCSQCHNLFDPRDRTAAAWPAIVKDMGARGNLDAADLQKIERYVVTMSEHGPAKL